MSLKKALLAATVLSLPMVAQAQPVTGLYIAAGAGANWRQVNTERAEDLTREQLAAVGIGVGSKIRTNLGYVGVGSIGWGFGNGIRAEIEGNYRYNEVDRVSVFGRQAFSSSGRIH